LKAKSVTKKYEKMRRQKTDDRRQKTDDRRQMTDDKVEGK
jgi:hypothetical protein